MATTYPPGWVARIERAGKIALDVGDGKYRSRNPEIEVGATAVEERLATYLKAEASRRKRRLSPDDEEVCRKFVLMVANWDTGHWSSRPVTNATNGNGRRSAQRGHSPDAE